MRAGFAQVAPAWLDGPRTLARVLDWISKAADESLDLLAFGEGLVPGYPFWPELTDGARFESGLQKALFAHYAANAVDVAGGGLDDVVQICTQRKIAVYLGVIEKATDRSAHSLYASLVYVDPVSGVRSVHRKLCPTYEERLVWSPGDGHGLRVHQLGPFRVGGLNCWENWMPLPRASLYAQGEDVHVAVWPGNLRNTRDITRFLAKEGRSFVISASGLMHRDWIDPSLPHADAITDGARSLENGWLADGGSCIAGPDGEWLVEPVVGKEALAWAELEPAFIDRERQNFDPAGHYARPDVTRLVVDRRRQSTAEFKDSES